MPNARPYLGIRRPIATQKWQIKKKKRKNLKNGYMINKP